MERVIREHLDRASQPAGWPCASWPAPSRRRAAVARCALAAFHLDEFRDLLTVIAEEIAPHRRTLRLDA